MLAIIEIWGHQHLIQENQQLVIDRLEWDEWSTLHITSVLCTFDDAGENIVLWQPIVAWADVIAKIVAHQQWEKMHIGKIQNKKRYRRRIGFRAQQTVLLIEKINA